MGRVGLFSPTSDIQKGLLSGCPTITYVQMVKGDLKPESGNGGKKRGKKSRKENVLVFLSKLSFF